MLKQILQLKYLQSNTHWQDSIVGPQNVHAGRSISVPTWTCPQAEKSIVVQKLNSPQDGEVHYADSAVGASNDCRQPSAL